MEWYNDSNNPPAHEPLGQYGRAMETLDTYECSTPSAPTEDALAYFRAQAKAELEEKSQRSKMSDAALAKLRAIKEQDRLQASSEERFASALRLIKPTPENLLTLTDRCNRSVPVQQLSRRAAKLGWWIAAGFRLGHEIDSLTMLSLFSDLTSEEKTASDSRFNNLWSPASAAKLRDLRTERGLIESGEPIYRACASGKKCMKFEKRKPAAAKGKGAYCSISCGAADRARAKRATATIPTS